MKRKAMIYGLLVVLFLLGVLLGTMVQSVSAVNLVTAERIVWTKSCSGDRVEIDTDMVVRCVKDYVPLPTPTWPPTATP